MGNKKKGKEIMPTIKQLVRWTIKTLNIPSPQERNAREQIVRIVKAIKRGNPNTGIEHILVFIQRNLGYISNRYPNISWKSMLDYAERPDKKTFEARIRAGTVKTKQRRRRK